MFVQSRNTVHTKEIKGAVKKKNGREVKIKIF